MYSEPAWSDVRFKIASFVGSDEEGDSCVQERCDKGFMVLRAQSLIFR